MSAIAHPAVPTDAFDPPERSGCGWVNKIARNKQDIERVCDETGAPRELAFHALDIDELARVDHHPEGAILVVMRVPCADEAVLVDTPLRTVSLSAILMKDSVLTIASAKLDVVACAARVRPRTVRSSAGIIIALVLATADRYLEHLRGIDAAVNKLENTLQQSSRNEELRRLLGHQKSLVHFRIGIRSNLIMLERLAKDTRVFSTAEERELLDDAMVEMSQAAEMTNVSSNILGEMMNAFASMISNNLNGTMKVMTALMIVIAVPSMVAAFYGMNVSLPGQHYGGAFFVVVLSALAAASALMVFFRRGRWL